MLKSLRDIFIAVAACEAIAVAIWLIPASLHVVDWPAGGPSRVALFAPQVSLVWFAVVALVLAVTAVLLSDRSTSRPRLVTTLAPLTLLWLWAVPYLPWLAERVPSLLVLAGPVRWVVAVAGVAAAGLRFAELPLSLLAARPALDPGWARRWVFVASLVLYSALGLLNARVVGPGGDEPHYLMISQSLLADGDLKIENNHQRREYRAFWGGDLRPDYMSRGIDGEIYSIHAPGLPLLLLPAYAAVGYQGTILILALMAALTALAVFDLSAAVAGPLPALWTWLGVGLTVPFVPHAWLIFPEMPGALIVAWAALWAWQPVTAAGLKTRPTYFGWVWRGVAFASLPWFHTKFIMFVAVFVPALMWRLRTNLRAMIALLAPIAISVTGWLLFFYLFYGSINPEAPYGDYPAINVLAKNIPRGLLGLMFDQKFGLALYSPIYAFAVVGCWRLLRRSDTRFVGAVLLAVTAVHVASTTRLYMWWGGTSAPARFLVPILPCLAPMIAAAAAGLQGRAARALFGTCLAFSLLVAAIGTGWPGRLFLYSDSRGYARLLETVQSGAPLTFALPTFTVQDWVTPIGPLVAWLIAAALGVGVTFAAARWLRFRAWSMLAAGGLVLLVSADPLAARPDAGAREAMARRGALDLIWAYDGGRLRPFEYATLAKIDETRVRELGRVTFGYPVAGFALPEGAYEARVWFHGTLEKHGEVVVTSSQRVTFGRASGALPIPTVVPFSLPVAVGRLSVAVSDQAVAASVARVEIAPTALISRALREHRNARRVEEIPERPRAYLVYVDDQAFPENGVFWTRATERTEVLLARGPYSRARLTLHLGPRAGDVSVAVAGLQKRVRVEPNGTAELELPLPDGLPLVPLTIQSPTMFRPSEVDSASNDTRQLGAQVRVSVE